MAAARSKRAEDDGSAATVDEDGGLEKEEERGRRFQDWKRRREGVE